MIVGLCHALLNGRKGFKMIRPFTTWKTKGLVTYFTLSETRLVLTCYCLCSLFLKLLIAQSCCHCPLKPFIFQRLLWLLLQLYRQYENLHLCHSPYLLDVSIYANFTSSFSKCPGYSVEDNAQSIFETNEKLPLLRRNFLTLKIDEQVC